MLVAALSGAGRLNAIPPAAIVSSTRPLSVRPWKQQLAERLA
jgi:hypothetical protein